MKVERKEMRRKNFKGIASKTAVITVLLIAVISFTGNRNQVQGHSAGAPIGYTDSPYDKVACNVSSCHKGPDTTYKAGLITSNIPAGGYTPDSTYSFTATVTRANHIRFGFEISPQNVAGTKLGTMIITNSDSTQLVGSGGYITHTSAGTLGTNGYHTWKFNWTAPAAGTGLVTFYGAFNVTNDDGTDKGDTIYTSTLAVKEAPTGIADLSMEPYNIKVYPTLVVSGLKINYQLNEQSAIKADLIDMQGRIVKNLFTGNQNPGTQTISTDLSGAGSGLYFILLKINNQAFVQKIVLRG